MNWTSYREVRSGLKRVARHARRPGAFPGLVWKNIKHGLMPPRAVSKSDEPRMWNELGRDIARLGNYEVALGAYERALAIRPDAPQILNNQGNALRATGRLREAEASLREALR